MIKGTKQKLQPLYVAHRKFVIYCLIGGVGATLDFVLYLILHYWAGVNPAVASFISVSVGIINNYILNVLLNFKVKTHLFHRFVNFYVVGAGGAIFSSIFIYVLFDIFSINATIAKLLSIPFVVIIQFILNRNYSFQENIQGNFLHASWRTIKKNALLMLINLAFLACTLSMVKTLPFVGYPAGPPDEITHYSYNVAIIIKDKRLPISGKDDIGAYKHCQNKTYSHVPCVYSYEVFPQANYIASALVSVIAHKTIGISYIKGSRLASVLWGLVFINLMYAGLKRLFASRKLALLLTGSLVFIPQVLFIFSYTNDDAHSLAISAFLFYALIRYLERPRVYSAVILGLAVGGLLPLAKYNFFILVFPVATIVLGALLKKRISYRNFIVLLAASTLSFAVLALPWYVRNYVLYHDFLGQSFMLKTMAHYHPLGAAYPLSFSTLALFNHLGFFKYLFESFFVALGSMVYLLPESQYSVVQFVVIGMLAYAVYLIINEKNRTNRRYLLFILMGFLLLLVSAVALVFYNSAYYDFQTQGRYLFPLIVPFAYSIGIASMINRKFSLLIPAAASITAFMFIGALGLYVDSYLFGG